MSSFRRHPYLITLAALLVILPVPVFAVGEGAVLDLVTVVFGLFVRLAAMLLNFSINHFVIDFGGVYANTGVGYAVDTTWIIIRDFVNMFFIFGFVYIGIKMILNSNDSNTRRWLVNLLLAALLVNFSLFATKFVVDFSNQLAAQIVVTGMGGEYTVNKSTNLAEVDLGQSFMNRMGITSIWENPVKGVGWGYIFGTAILFMITTFVFAAGGILLIIRFAVLNLFLVLSPVMFLSWILPGLKDTMNRYWSMFLGRAFFAPIYFLFIYFSLQIISGLQVAVSGPGSNLANPSWAGTFQAVGNAGPRTIQDSTLGTLPFFVLICVFMIASLVVAQKMGADGGSKAVSMGKSLSNKARRTTTKLAGSATLGVAGVAGQQTFGRMARSQANNDDLQRRAAEGSYRARVQLAAARKVADSSFDARRVGGMGKALGIGEGKKGGIETRIKDKQKKEEEFMKSLKTDVSLKDSEKIKKEEEEKLEKENQETDKELETIEAVAENSGKNTVALTNEINDLGRDIEGLSSALAAKVSAGTITTSEREAEEKKIADLTTTQRKKTLARDERKSQLEIQAEIRKNSASAAAATNPVEAARFREEEQRLQSELNKKLNYTRRQELADKRKAEIGTSEKRDKLAAREATKRENEIKYKNQITHMETMKRRAERSWDPRVTEESVENLQKKFGRSQEEMAKKDKENKAKSDVLKSIKEAQDAEAKGETPPTPPPPAAGA